MRNGFKIFGLAIKISMSNCPKTVTAKTREILEIYCHHDVIKFKICNVQFLFVFNFNCLRSTYRSDLLVYYVVCFYIISLVTPDPAIFCR